MRLKWETLQSILVHIYTENLFYIAFVVLLQNWLEYVKGTKYFAIDYLAV